MAGVPVVPQMCQFRDMFDLKDFDPETVACDKENEYMKSIEQMKPIQPVVDLLLNNVGKMPIGCGAGGDRVMATKTLHVIGVYDKVNALVSSDDVMIGKPAIDTSFNVHSC